LQVALKIAFQDCGRPVRAALIASGHVAEWSPLSVASEGMSFCETGTARKEWFALIGVHNKAQALDNVRFRSSNSGRWGRQTQ
jgi:hypothetical protein